MFSPLFIAVVSLLAVLLVMLAESQVSRRNERRLRQYDVLEPPDDVYWMMRWAYPAAFVAMAAEGALFGPPAGVTTIAGVVLLGVSKALKWWAVASLGTRWTFRVLIVPGAPLVRSGPYAVLRHPNYVAVVGELVSMALLVGARVSGPVVTLLFGLLLRQRIRVENRVLQYPPCT